MLIVPSGVKIHLALGHTDMRQGFESLAVLEQPVLKKDPFSGHLFTPALNLRRHCPTVPSLIRQLDARRG
jgi:transposase